MLNMLLGILVFHNALNVVFSLSTRNKLLVVSLDGFRSDYLSKINPKYLKMLMYNGVSPRNVKTTFVTKTFPTHLSIVTGLYEESHGIVSNKMWDKETEKVFTLKNNSTRDEFWFRSLYPVWMTAEDNQIKSGIYFWPGSEVTYNNRRPSKYKTFDLKANFTDMINNVTDWLINKDIDLAFMYFIEPDYTSHGYGPFANKTIKKVLEMDQNIGRIIDIVNKSKIKDNINYIFLSDHGMSDVKKILNFSFPQDIRELIKMTTDISPIYGIFPRPGYKLILYRKLEEFFKQYKDVKVYLKELLPQRFHYSNNERIPDLLILGGENVALVDLDSSDATNAWMFKGSHGYDNNIEDMNSFLVAQGPDLKQSLGTPTDFIDQIDIYHLICALLKIKPRQNNGTLKAVNMFLVDSARIEYMEILKLGTTISLYKSVYCVINITILYNLFL